jgi:hypothetical protein
MKRSGFFPLSVSAVLAALYAWHLYRSDRGTSRTGATVLVVPASSASTSVASQRQISSISHPAQTHDPARREDAYQNALQRVSRDIAPLLAEAPDLKYLHRRLLAEGRDEVWAARSEEILNNTYRDVAGFKEAGTSIEVHCGTTLCEVYVDPTTHEGKAAGLLMDHIQSADLAADLWNHGYRNRGAAYGPVDQGHDANVTYYQREAPVKVGTRPSP